MGSKRFGRDFESLPGIGVSEVRMRFIGKKIINDTKMRARSGGRSKTLPD